MAIRSPKLLYLLSSLLCYLILISGCNGGPSSITTITTSGSQPTPEGRVPSITLTEVPTEAPTEVPTEASTEVPTEASTEVPTEAPTEALTEAPTEGANPEPISTPTHSQTEIPTDIEKETYDSVGIWAIPPDYLEFSLSEMSVSTIDGYFSSDKCFCKDHDPLQEKLHIVFNQCNSFTSTTPEFLCSYKMDKSNTGLPVEFFSAPIMRLIFYAEIDPLIPTESGKTSFITKSQFVAQINCSTNPDSLFYNPTTFYIGDGRSYYHNEAGNTFIGPEHSTNETNKKAFVLIVDFRPQFLGYDKNGEVQQRTPVFLYRYVFPDTGDRKDPIEIIQDALKKTVNPGIPTDGTLDQEFTEERGDKIYYNCRLNLKNPGYMIAGVGSEVEDGIGVNVKFQYVIFENQHSIDYNLFAKPYGSLD